MLQLHIGQEIERDMIRQLMILVDFRVFTILNLFFITHKILLKHNK